jgi:Pyridoxamine 5'-phosphate oxidase
MGNAFEGIGERLARWIAEQQVFFVASAPLDANGHINVSPKGPIGTLRVLDANTIAYLDLVGSGAETIAHVRENGRIVVMFCAFDGPPRVLRVYGRAAIVTGVDPAFTDLVRRCAFDEPAVAAARRAVVLVDVTRVADSCGYGVPLMSYEGQRPHMDAWAEKKVRVRGSAALLDYQRENNSLSIDGLPAIDLPDAAVLVRDSGASDVDPGVGTT